MSCFIIPSVHTQGAVHELCNANWGEWGLPWYYNRLLRQGNGVKNCPKLCSVIYKWPLSSRILMLKGA